MEAWGGMSMLAWHLSLQAESWLLTVKTKLARGKFWNEIFISVSPSKGEKGGESYSAPKEKSKTFEITQILQ